MTGQDATAPRIDPVSSVAGLWKRFDAEMATGLLEEVSRCDRFQSSTGIERAADAVAAAAERCGLEDVQIHSWGSDGSPRWWTFAGPPAWTPEGASLTVSAAGETVLGLGYPRDSCALAAYSHRWHADGAPQTLLRASDLADPAQANGRIVLCDEECPDDQLLRQLERSGACGVICGADRSGLGVDDLRPRVELAFGSSLFAFSVSAAEMRALSAHGGVLEARARVDIGERGRMPVVTGRLSGEPNEEFLVLSHLCHPRPSANDNASGVAASMAVADCLASSPADRHFGIRFLWGPEFVGSAAYLHDLVCSGRMPRPCEAINLDVVGQRDTPLLVEHPPAYVGAILPAVIEQCFGAIGREAPGFDAEGWAVAPFSGASDHAVFLDRSVAIPAAQVGQAPDRFNHSSADCLERVSIGSVRRAAVAVAAALDVLSRGPDPGALAGWLAGSAVRRAQRAPLGRRAYVLEALASSLGEARGRYGLTERQRRQALAEAGGCLEGAAPSLHPGNAGDRSRGLRDRGDLPVERRWPGPFNLRGLLHLLPASNRQRLERLLAADRRGSYAAVQALAAEIDDKRPATEVLDRAATLCGFPIEARLAEAFLDALRVSGWANAR